MLLARAFIRLEFFYLRAVHKLHHLIGLPFLEAEPQPLVTIVLVVSLVLVILDLNKVAVNGRWVERQGDEGVDGGGFGDDFESP